MQYIYDFHLQHQLVDVSQMLGEFGIFIATGMSTMCLGIRTQTSSLLLI